MSSKIISIILLTLGILLTIGVPVFIMIHVEEIYYEALCVDGDGDVNLEGMMCEKGGNSLFGSEDLFTAMAILPFMGIILCIVGFMFSLSD